MKKSTYIWIAILAVIFNAIILMGSLFKITHWPGANLLLWVGFLGDIFTICFFIYQYRKQN